MQITLLRHGKPEFELSGNVKACELSEIAKCYDLSGIIDAPPKDAMIQTKMQDIVVCSNLPRSLQSAKALGVTEVYLATPVFREASIPHFSSGSIKLPINAWVILLRGLWYFGFSKNGESLVATKERAKQATQELIRMAKQFDSVLLVGHGFINYFIAKELLSQKWRGPKKPASDYWNYSVYQYNAT